jgi:uncharacterized protein DUF4186
MNLKPLKITCTKTACNSGLHCFLQTRKMVNENRSGECRDCGARLVDWERVHKLDLSDVAYTFRMLKYEYIRHHFWHIDFDQKAINHALRKGKKGMRAAAENRIRRSVGPAEPAFDGRQTPKSGNLIYYAQHATATCCRKCIQEWHGINMGEALAEQQISYFADLIMLFIDDRMPKLGQEGIKVPRVTLRKSSRKKTTPSVVTTDEASRNRKMWDE